MPAAKYDGIYRDLKNKIESEQYEFQELLPSENQLVEVYGCSRNTVRRGHCRPGDRRLRADGSGKGVRNIYRPVPQSSFTIGSIESFRESSIRNRQEGRTKVVLFTELTADRKIARNTGFAPGTALFYIQRCIT